MFEEYPRHKSGTWWKEGEVSGTYLLMEKRPSADHGHCRWLVQCLLCKTERVVNTGSLVAASDAGCITCAKREIKNINDFAGKYFGVWEVLPEHRWSSGVLQVKVRCNVGHLSYAYLHLFECGECKACSVCQAAAREVLRLTNAATRQSRPTKTYGKLLTEAVATSASLSVAVNNSMWGRIIASAENRKMGVFVAKETVFSLLATQGFGCALSGEKLFLAASPSQDKHGYGNASLDRIDSTKTYVDGNVQWVTKEVNVMKGDLSQDRFLYLCASVANHAGKYGSAVTTAYADDSVVEPSEYALRGRCPYWTSIKHGALKRGLCMDITYDDALSLLASQDYRCALSGLPLTTVWSRSGKLQKGGTASLDRIDASVGYTSTNIQWVHKEINTMKMHIPQSRFVEICAAVSEFTKPFSPETK